MNTATSIILCAAALVAIVFIGFWLFGHMMLGFVKSIFKTIHWIVDGFRSNKVDRGGDN